MFPRTVIPQLLGEVTPHCPRVFASAILAGPDASNLSNIWIQPPQLPTVEVLREKVARVGIPVEIVSDVLRSLV
jgi:hypothetical protein